jgi:hypothetical protein
MYVATINQVVDRMADQTVTREDMQTLKNDWLTDNVGDMELSAGL